MMIDKPKKKISLTARFFRFFVHPLIWPVGRVELKVPPALTPVEWIFNAMPDDFRHQIFQEIGWIVGEELAAEDN